MGGKTTTVLLFLLAMFIGPPASVQGQDWTFGPFEKPGQVNPIITPNAATTFLSPMTDRVVHWEELATFNPAAVVKNGKLYVLYRTEDDTGNRNTRIHTA